MLSEDFPKGISEGKSSLSWVAKNSAIIFFFILLGSLGCHFSLFPCFLGTQKERKNLNEVIDTIEIKKEDLLDTVIINDKMYFFENKEKGNIFDSNSKQVGIYKNGKHILFI